VRENILDRYPSTPLSVYVVWMPMLATDARSEWESSALPDRRVRHYWDEERVVGRWLADQDIGGTGYAGIVWDAFFVFGPDASWDDVPEPLLAAGAPVIGDTEQLASALQPLLDA
jgi:hypothetical protein